MNRRLFCDCVIAGGAVIKERRGSGVQHLHGDSGGE